MLRGRRALQVPARARAGAVSGGRWRATRGRSGSAGRRPRAGAGAPQEPTHSKLCPELSHICCSAGTHWCQELGRSEYWQLAAPAPPLSARASTASLRRPGRKAPRLKYHSRLHASMSSSRSSSSSIVHSPRHCAASTAASAATALSTMFIRCAGHGCIQPHCRPPIAPPGARDKDRAGRRSYAALPPRPSGRRPRAACSSSGEDRCTGALRAVRRAARSLRACTLAVARPPLRQGGEGICRRRSASGRGPSAAPRRTPRALHRAMQLHCARMLARHRPQRETRSLTAGTARRRAPCHRRLGQSPEQRQVSECAGCRADLESS